MHASEPDEPPPSDPDRDVQEFAPLQDWVTLVAPSNLDAVDQINALFDRLTRTRMEEETLDKLKYVINELVANAVEWGNRRDENRKVTLSYALFDDKIVLKVQDEGEGFNVKDLPPADADLKKLAEERKKAGKRVGGLGLLLARKMMDSVLFNEQGNIVLITKFF